MARIAFFTERLPNTFADAAMDSDPVADFSFELIRSLADQQHEIRVFSTYREGAELPEPHPRIEIIRPFKKWSWLELPKLLPILLDFQPEILHLIQPRGEALQGFTNAMSALPGFAPLLGQITSRPVIVSSFYDLRDENLKTHRLLLGTSDAITVSNEPQLRLIGKYVASLGFSERRTPKIIVLPVPGRAVTGDQYSDANRPETLLRTVALGNPWIFIPGDVSENREPEFLFREFATALSNAPDLHLVIGGGWGKIPTRNRHALMRIFDDAGVGSRVVLTGPLSFETERWCLMKATFSFTASLPAETLGLQRVLREALEVAAPLMMSDEQAHLDALSWQHAENSLIVRREKGIWSQAIIKAIQEPAHLERIRAKLPEFSRAEAVDQPGNVMSRIYAGILDKRRLR